MYEVAEAHQARQIQVSETAVARSLRAWRRIDLDALSDSWASGVGESVVGAVSGAQRRSAALTNNYMGSLADSSRDRVAAASFAGIDGEGRGVEGVLFGAVTTTKTEIARGAGRVSAFEAGGYYLAAVVKTLIGDIARSSDLVGSAGAGFTRYVRVVEPGACSRCVALAGAAGMKPFKRHPACRCTVMPVRSGTEQSANSVFDAMSTQDQDRAFGKAGAQAIRDGADVTRVVNARRGASGISYSSRHRAGEWSGRRLQPTTIGSRSDGSPLRVYTTTEGSTRRSLFGQQQRALGTPNRIRLMPETILELSPDDAAVRRAMFRDAGYLDFPPSLSPAERLLAQTRDRELVDRVYRSNGITLN